MSWVNPPPSIVNARDTLLRLATVTTSVLPAPLDLAGRQARCHYPRSTDSGDALPLFVFRREGYRGTRGMATGYRSSGRCIVLLFVDATLVDDGTLETWGEGIVDDLTSLGASDIQYAVDAECGEAVEPSPQQLAAAVSGQPGEPGRGFRVMSISWNWET